MTLCLIALGANLGQPAQTVSAAINDLASISQTELIASSTLHTTSPVGGPAGQPTFVNAAATLRTMLSVEELHQALIKIEEKFGRVRVERWGERKLDLDLLLFGDSIIETNRLTVPHPRMTFRRFVLGPAIEIAATIKHPISKCTIQQLWDSLPESTPKLELVSLGFSLFQKLQESLSTHQIQPLFLTEASSWNLYQLKDQQQDLSQQVASLFHKFRDQFRMASTENFQEKAALLSYISPVTFAWLTTLHPESNQSSELFEPWLASQAGMKILWEQPYELFDSRLKVQIPATQYQQWNEQLRTFFFAHLTGSYLHIEHGSVADAQVEILAAVQAMKPLTDQ